MTIAAPYPSNAGRWIPCPASARLESQIQEIKGNDAKEGDAAHWVAAEVLSGRFQLEELTDRAAPNGTIVTGEMVEHVETYITAVRAIAPVVVVENPLPPIMGMKEAVPDCRVIVQDRGFIWDFKYGFKIVDVVGNWQGIVYSVLLFIKHEWNLADVTFTIVQPRPYHIDGRIRSWTITRDQAWSYYQLIKTAITETQNPTAPVRSGPHCLYCNALHICEAARQAGYNGIDVSLSGKIVSELPPDELSKELFLLRRAAEAMKLRLDAAESHALNIINNGGIVPGWSAERAFGNRQWKNDSDATVLGTLFGLDLIEAKPVSPAQAEKRGLPKDVLKDYVTQRETGRKLVPRDGSKKAKEVFK